MAGERITYRFGRSSFRNFEAGNTKEWLLSNGIGGYANSTIHGNSSRAFSAYLIASLHPPVDRVLVLAKTHEELLFSKREDGHRPPFAITQGGGGGCPSACTEQEERARLFALGDRVPPEASTEGVSVERRDFATQQYPGYIREGYRYQTGFTFDIWPEYSYQTDGVAVRKRIALAYGKNETAIHYELSNHGSREAVFSVTPLFNFRPFGEVNEKGGLRFDVEQSENRLLLTPHAAKEYRICFAASEGEFYDRAKRPVSMATPNYVIEENELYCTDVSNGFTGVDNHFTPYELHVALAPGESKEIGLLCGLAKAEEVSGKASAAEAQEGSAARESMKAEAQEKGAARESGGDVLERVHRIFADAAARAERLLAQAGSRDALTGRLVLSADNFLVRRESTGLMTVLAGYPWFADWGRDTMIAFTGLTLATGRFSEAREVLLSFAKYVSQGMLPNVFPNSAKEEPMYNTIDASLWYFYAVYKYLQYTTGLPCYKEGMEETNRAASASAQETLHEEEIFVRDAIYPVLQEIFASYRDGKARYGIHMDEDGLIAGGGGLDQLTWMDVRVGNIVVTPRHGKAVEINALWYNALRCMELFEERFGGDGDSLKKTEGFCALAQKVSRSFEEKFWNEAKGCLYDTVDESGRGDAGIRPNQIFAVSLPFTMLSGDKERSIVRVVYEKLYTPYGLRSLAQEEAGYRAEYTGRLIKRDLAYHMGTAWGYLSGAFFDAWAKTMCRGKVLTEAQISQNKELLHQMLENFADHMADGCLGGIAEIFDGDFACGSRGCYTQAWSVGEVLRAIRELA